MVAGGGGAANTGVKNGFEVFQVILLQVSRMIVVYVVFATSIQHDCCSIANRLKQAHCENDPQRSQLLVVVTLSWY